MKKRLLSFLMCLTMTLSFVPVMPAEATADKEDISPEESTETLFLPEDEMSTGDEPSQENSLEDEIVNEDAVSSENSVELMSLAKDQGTMVIGGKTVKCFKNTFNQYVYDGVTYAPINVETPEDGYLFYDYNPNTDITPGEILIADSVDGIPVLVVQGSLNELKNITEPDKQVKKITLGVNVKEIWSDAFWNLKSLQEISIPENSNLYEISSNAFNGCSNLRRIGVGNTEKLPASLTLIQGYAFQGTGIKTLDMSDTQVVSLRDCTFADSALESFVAPNGLYEMGAMVFASCLKLRTLDFPVSLDGVWIQAFRDCTALEKIVFRGGVPTGTNGYTAMGTGSLTGVNPNCVIEVPRPRTEEEYTKALTHIYSSTHGDAPATVSLRWLDRPGRYQKKPSDPYVSQESLNALQEVTVDTGSKAEALGVAAIVTMADLGEFAKIEVEAKGERGTNIYWSYGKAYDNERGIHPVTNKQYTGKELTNSMIAVATRSETNNPWVNLNVGGVYGSYFFYPISTRPGNRNTPETSSIGKPILVICRPGETSLPELKVDRSNSIKVYGLEDGGEKMGRPVIIADGFETLYDHQPVEGELAKIETEIDGVLTETASLKYEWLDTKKPSELGTGKGTPLEGCSGYLTYGGYMRSGSTDSTIWYAEGPSQSVRQGLEPGVHFIYAKITMIVGGKTHTVYTSHSSFYRFDPDLLRSKLVPGGDFTTSSDGENWANKDADVYCNVVMDYTQVEAKDPKHLAGYKELEEYIDEYYWSEQYSLDDHSVQGELLDFQNSISRMEKSSFRRLHTAPLTTKYESSDPGSDPSKDADSIMVQCSIHYSFGYILSGNSSNSKGFGIRATGETTPSGENFIDKDAPQWSEVRSDFNNFPIYTEKSGRPEGKFELYRVNSATQARGGKLVLQSDENTAGVPFWSNANSETEILDGVTYYRLVPYINHLEEVEHSPGLNFYYWRLISSGGTEYGPVFTRFSPSVESTTSSTIAENSVDEVYLQPNGKTTLEFSAQAKNFMDTFGETKVEFSTDDGKSWQSSEKDYEYEYSLPSGIWNLNNDSKRKSEMIGGDYFLHCSDSVTLVESDTRKNYVTEKPETRHFMDVYASGKSEVLMRMAWNINNAPVYSSPVRIRASKETVNLEVTAVKPADGKPLAGTMFSLMRDGKDDSQGIVFTAKTSGAASDLRWVLTYNNGEDIILTKDGEAKTNFGETTQEGKNIYVTAAWNGNSSTLTFPATGNLGGRSFTIRAEALTKDGISGSISPIYTLMVNSRKNAEKPSPGYSEFYGNPLKLMPGQTNLPEINAYCSVSDGGSLSWQWYRCTDDSGLHATAVKGASGTGKNASWQLSQEITNHASSFYYFCEYTNTNLAAQDNKTVTGRTAVKKIAISDSFSAITAPEPVKEKSYSFTYTVGGNLPEGPFDLKVKKPESLKNIPKGEPSCIPEQVVTFHAKIDDGTTKQESEVPSYDISRTEEGGYYVYTVKPDKIPSYFNPQSDARDPATIYVWWTVSHIIADDKKPSNMAYGTDIITVDTAPAVALYRKPIAAPVIEELKFSNLTETTYTLSPELTAELDKEPSDNTIRAFSQAKDNSSYHPVSLNVKWDKSPEGDILQTVEHYNYKSKKWDKGINKYWPDPVYLDCVDGAKPSLYRIKLDAHWNSLAAPYVWSEMIAVLPVDNAKDAAEPVKPENMPSNTPYIIDSGKMNSETIRIGIPGWTVPDGGTLSYQWIYYDNHNKQVSLTSSVPGWSTENDGQVLVLTKDFPRLKEVRETIKNDPQHKASNFIVSIIATNTNPKADGVQTKDLDYNFTVEVGRSVPIPEGTVNIKGKSDLLHWQDAYPSVELTVTNGKGLNSAWWLDARIVELDEIGKEPSAVSGDVFQVKVNCGFDETGKASFTITDSHQNFKVESNLYKLDNVWNVYPDLESLTIEYSYRVEYRPLSENDAQYSGKLAKKAFAPLKITLRRPLTPVFEKDSEGHDVTFLAHTDLQDTYTLPVELSGGTVRGFRQGYYFGSRKKCVVRPVLLNERAGDELIVHKQMWNKSQKKWGDSSDISDSFGGYDQNGPDEGVYFFRVAAWSQSKETKKDCPKVYSEIYAVECLKNVSNAGMPQSPEDMETWYDFVIDSGKENTKSLTLGKPGWTSPDGGDLSFEWVWDPDDGSGEELAITGKETGVSISTDGQTLTIDETSQIIKRGKELAEENKKAGMGLSSSLAIKIKVVNTNNTLPGNNTQQGGEFFTIKFSTKVQTPEIYVTLDKTELRCGQEAPATAKAEIKNLKDYPANTDFEVDWYYQVVEIDDSPVKANRNSWNNTQYFDNTASVKIQDFNEIGNWSLFVYVKDNHWKYLDLSSNGFWADPANHESLKLKITCFVQVSDSSSGISEVEGISEPLYVKIRRAEPAKKTAVTIERLDKDGIVVETWTDNSWPEIINIPKEGTFRLSAPTEDSIGMRWELSTTGKEGDFVFDITENPWVLDSSDMTKLRQYPFIRAFFFRNTYDQRYKCWSQGGKVMQFADAAPDKAREPFFTEDSSYFAHEGESVTLNSNAVSIDGGSLSYQWYKFQDGKKIALKGETKPSYTAKTPASCTTAHYMVEVTNTNPKATITSSSTVDHAIDLTGFGIKISLPEIPIKVKSGENFEIPIKVERFLSDSDNYETNWDITPASLKVYENQEIEYIQGNITEKTEGTLQLNYTINGKTYSTENISFTILPEDFLITTESLSGINVKSENVSLPALTASTNARWSFAQGYEPPEWLTISPEGVLTVSRSPDRPAYYPVKVQAESGGKKTEKSFDLPICAPYSAAWLYIGNMNIDLREKDKSGVGWSYDGRLHVLTLNNFVNGDSAINFGSIDGESYLRLVGNNWIGGRNSGLESIYKRTDNPQMLHIMSEGNATLSIKTDHTGYNYQVEGIEGFSGLEMDKGVSMTMDLTGDWVKAINTTGDFTLKGGKLKVLANSSRDISTGYYHTGIFAKNVIVENDADLDVQVRSTKGTRQVSGIMGNLHTKGTGNVHILSDTLENTKRYSVKAVDGKVTVEHTAGSLIMESYKAGKPEGQVVSENLDSTVAEGRYYVKGSLDSPYVSYRVLSKDDAPIIETVFEDNIVPLIHNMELNNSVIARAISENPVEWSVTGLPKGITWELTKEGYLALNGKLTADLGDYLVTLTATVKGKPTLTNSTSFTFRVEPASLYFEQQNADTIHDSGTDKDGNLYVPYLDKGIFQWEFYDGIGDWYDPASVMESVSVVSGNVEAKEVEPGYLEITPTAKAKAGETAELSIKITRGKESYTRSVKVYLVNPTPNVFRFNGRAYENMISRDEDNEFFHWDHKTSTLTLKGENNVVNELWASGGDMTLVYSGKCKMTGLASLLDHKLTLKAKDDKDTLEVNCRIESKEAVMEGGNVFCINKESHYTCIESGYENVPAKLTLRNVNEVLLAENSSNPVVQGTATEKGKIVIENSGEPYALCNKAEEGFYHYAAKAFAPAFATFLPSDIILSIGDSYQLNAEINPYSMVNTTETLDMEFKWQTSKDGILWENVPGADKSAFEVPTSDDGDRLYRCSVKATSIALPGETKTALSSVCEIHVQPKAIMEGVLSGNTLEYTVKAITVSEPMILAAARYDDEGRMEDVRLVELDPQTFVDGQFTGNLELSGNGKMVKLFLTDKTSCSPICDALSLTK